MKRIFHIIVKIAVAIVVFIVGMMVFFWLGIFVFPKFIPDQQRIERYLGVSLPTDVSNLQTRIDEGFQDDLFILRFTVP